LKRAPEVGSSAIKKVFFYFNTPGSNNWKFEKVAFVWNQEIDQYNNQ